MEDLALDFRLRLGGSHQHSRRGRLPLASIFSGLRVSHVSSGWCCHLHIQFGVGVFFLHICRIRILERIVFTNRNSGRCREWQVIMQYAAGSHTSGTASAAKPCNWGVSRIVRACLMPHPSCSASNQRHSITSVPALGL